MKTNTAKSVLFHSEILFGANVCKTFKKALRCINADYHYHISLGIYGEKGIEVFHDLAKKNNIHTDHIDTITRIAKEEEYDDIIEEMVARVGETAVSTVIVFCSLQHSHGLTMAAQRNPKSSKFVWVLSDSFEASTVTELNNICILTIQLKKEGLDTFKHYFNKLNMKDPKWEKHPAIVQFWEQWFQCRVGNTSSRSYPECTGEESLANVSQSFIPQPITLAFYAFVQGLDNLQKELCGNQTGICPGMRHFQRARLLQHLRNVSFQNFFNTSLAFDTNGEVKAKKYRILNFQQVGTSKSYKCIGEWDGQKSGEKLDINLDDIMWFGAGNRSIPQSYCSTDCDFGYVKIKREGYSFDHCWKCHECDKLQLIVNNTCIPGIPGYIPNAARNKWIKRYVLYLRWSDAISIIMVVVSVVAIIFALAVLFIFSTFHNNATVKASGRELSCIIITGILLCFIHVFLCIAKPTDVTCIARAVMPGFALSMIYSALFMKTNRVYRVFASAMITKRRPPLVRPKSQVLITFGLISIEILITVLGQLTNITRASENYNSDTKKLILECHSNSMSYVGSLLYIVVLMILSTVYAFKTRKFPRNFNESKYIGATLYISLAVSTLFVAFYLNAGDSTIQVTITAIGSLLIGLITLLGLFAQRLFIIFFVKDADADDSFTMRQYQSKENSRSSVGSQKH